MPRWKRGLDLAIVGLALPLALGVGLLVCAWIRLVSPGAVLYRQTRVGKDGRRFTIYKFRSMHASAAPEAHRAHVRRLVLSEQPMVKLDQLGDDRLIRGGRFLRMSGIDELPQLLNVARGDMSLVGPRPCLPEELEFYGDGGLRRFTVEPGLTGRWQVDRSASTTFRQMLSMDEEYVRNRSLRADLAILLRTPLAVVRQFRLPVRPRAARPAHPVRGAASFGRLREPTHAARNTD